VAHHRSVESERLIRKVWISEFNCWAIGASGIFVLDCSSLAKPTLPDPFRLSAVPDFALRTSAHREKLASAGRQSGVQCA